MRLRRRTIAEVLGIYLDLIDGTEQDRLDAGAGQRQAYQDLFDAFTRLEARATDAEFATAIRKASALARSAFERGDPASGDEESRAMLRESREVFWSIALRE